MSLFRKLFRSGNIPESIKTSDPPCEIEDFSGIENIELKTHLDTVNKEFKFLIQDLGFILTKNRFVGRELWTVFIKDNISVQIIFETGSLPWVMIKNSDLPYDESKEMDNRTSVEEYSNKLKEINAAYLERIKPMTERSILNNYDRTEFNDDYLKKGQEEHETYLIEAAAVVRYIIENKKGVLETTAQTNIK